MEVNYINHEKLERAGFIKIINPDHIQSLFIGKYFKIYKIQDSESFVVNVLFPLIETQEKSTKLITSIGYRFIKNENELNRFLTIWTQKSISQHENVDWLEIFDVFKTLTTKEDLEDILRSENFSEQKIDGIIEKSFGPKT
jgi:hypothetical protein